MSDIKCYIAETQDQINEMCNVALNERLYVVGWMLIDELYRKTAATVALAYDDQTPVGIILVTKDSHVMTFIKEEYRRKGIATKLIRSIKMPESAVWGKGVEGSKQFYKKEMPFGRQIM